MKKSDIGLVGLAVMGENLVMNMESKGFTVSVYNRTVEKVDRFINGRAKGKNIVGAHSLEELVSQLDKPRKVMMMVKAGAAVEPQSDDPRRQADPRAKVYDDAATAPFLAKDVDKFWKPENAEYVAKVASFIDEYAGEWTVPAFEKALEDYIRGNEWPMGKVMNATRLALAGASSGLGIADIIVRIGKRETLGRIAYATNRLA